MRSIYLAGGPRHGTVIQAEDLKTVDHQPEYQPVYWMAFPELKDWRDADFVVFVHISVPGNERMDVAANGASDLLARYPDTGP